MMLRMNRKMLLLLLLTNEILIWPTRAAPVSRPNYGNSIGGGSPEPPVGVPPGSLLGATPGFPVPPDSFDGKPRPSTYAIANWPKKAHIDKFESRPVIIPFGTADFFVGDKNQKGGSYSNSPPTLYPEVPVYLNTIAAIPHHYDITKNFHARPTFNPNSPDNKPNFVPNRPQNEDYGNNFEGGPQNDYGNNFDEGTQNDYGNNFEGGPSSNYGRPQNGYGNNFEGRPPNYDEDNYDARPPSSPPGIPPGSPPGIPPGSTPPRQNYNFGFREMEAPSASAAKSAVEAKTECKAAEATKDEDKSLESDESEAGTDKSSKVQASKKVMAKKLIAKMMKEMREIMEKEVATEVAKQMLSKPAAAEKAIATSEKKEAATSEKKVPDAKGASKSVTKSVTKPNTSTKKKTLAKVSPPAKSLTGSTKKHTREVDAEPSEES